MPYRDLREFLDTLRKNDLLWVIDRPIVKETELFPLVRLQFRGLDERSRRGFLFTNVIDVNGKHYDASVTVASLAASRKVYALGMECDESQITEKFVNAIKNPLPPKQVEYGPVYENVITGDELKKNGLSILPVPVELPGFSGQVRTTTAFITKDIETGIQNAGVYSGQIFGPNTILWEIHRGSDGFTHLKKALKANRPLDAAIVVGGPPAIQYAAAAKVPYGLDELAVAGAINGAPIEVVKGKTVDLLVPAYAEYVIEGKIYGYAEPQTPFGEYTGYMAAGIESQLAPVMEVTAILHRNNPVFQMIISQMPPSESSKLRQVAYESAMTKHLRDHGLPVVQVAFPETSGSWQMCVISLKKIRPTDAPQALMAAASYAADVGKIFVAVDDDIDPHDMDSVVWALSFRMQPKRDITIVGGKASHLDPSAAPPGEEGAESGFRESSAILIDATRKWPYPPVSLPKKEYMEHALQLWKELGLPELKLKSPWYGYNLGYWNDEYERIAKMIVEGKHFEVGKELENKKTKLNIESLG